MSAVATAAGKSRERTTRKLISPCNKASPRSVSGKA
jgi:hypothetical protein